MVGLRNGCTSTTITKLFMSCHAPFKVGRVNGLAAKSRFAALVREVDTKVLRATRVRDHARSLSVGGMGVHHRGASTGCVLVAAFVASAGGARTWLASCFCVSDSDSDEKIGDTYHHSCRAHSVNLSGQFHAKQQSSPSSMLRYFAAHRHGTATRKERVLKTVHMCYANTDTQTGLNT